MGRRDKSVVALQCHNATYVPAGRGAAFCDCALDESSSAPCSPVAALLCWKESCAQSSWL